MNLRRFIAVFGALLLTVSLALGGCQKKEEAAAEHPQEKAAQPAADTSHAAQPAQQ